MKGDFSRRVVHFPLIIIAVLAVALAAYSEDVEEAKQDLSDDIVKILKPKGSNTDTMHPEGSFITDSPPFRYDFQGVASEAPNSYPIEIRGFVRSPFEYSWALEASAGTLDNHNQPIVHHAEPSMEGSSLLTKSGRLTLTALGADPEVQEEQRYLVIYKDHLKRHMDNFQFLDPPILNCTHFTRPGSDGNVIGFNCHQSTMHGFNGTRPPGPPYPFENWSRSFSEPPLYFEFLTIIQKKEVELKRGDVIAYYRDDSLVHSQTVVSDQMTMTWGANNDPPPVSVDPYIPPKYAYCEAGRWCENIAIIDVEHCYTIQIYRKP